MIKVEDIHKSFGEHHVLKGISTTFEKGKTNLIIGQSGSGKSSVTAWLAAHGFSYLTDELIMMPDACLGKAIPFTRPVCIKKGSAAEINKLI